MWPFKKDKNVKHSIKKMDAIVTGLVLGGIVASVYGIKKHEQEKRAEEKIQDTSDKMSNKSILKALIFGHKEKTISKPSLWRRVLASPFIFIKRLGKK